MAATNTDVKNFFALTGNNPSVTNTKLTRMAAALGARIHEDGSPATSEELVDFLYQDLKNIVVYYEQDRATAAARAAVTF